MLQSQACKEGDVAKIAKSDREIANCLNLDYRTVKKYNQCLIDYNIANEYIMQGKDETGLNKKIKYVDMIKLHQAVLFNLAVQNEKIESNSEQLNDHDSRLVQLEKQMKDLARDNANKDKIISELQSKIDMYEGKNSKEFEF